MFGCEALFVGCAVCKQTERRSNDGAGSTRYPQLFFQPWTARMWCYEIGKTEGPPLASTLSHGVTSAFKNHDQQPWSWAVQAIIHENFGDKCFKCCDAAAIFFLALSSDRDGSFWWQGPSWSLFPMPLLSALSAPCSSSPHFPVGPTFQ